MSEWQPIETAPKNKPVLVYAPGYYDLPEIICRCEYHKDAGWTIDDIRNVTHWQPLPPPPESK